MGHGGYLSQKMNNKKKLRPGPERKILVSNYFQHFFKPIFTVWLKVTSEKMNP